MKSKSKERSAAKTRLEASQDREKWLTGQSDAFKAAVNGEPLEKSLNILISTAIEQMGGKARGAFYTLNEKGIGLHHVVGMPDNYSREIEGFIVGNDSFAHDLAIGIAEPVITPDVREEPRWASWLWLAEKYHFRACWSFPVETAGGKLVGTLAVYFEEPRTPTPGDLKLAQSLTSAASIIIAQSQSSAALREIQRRQTAMLEVVPVGIALVDREGKVMMSNPEMRHFMPNGRVPSSDEDRTWRWRTWDAQGKPIDPKDFPMERALRGKAVVPGMEFLYRRDDDKEVWTRVAAVPIVDDIGAVTGGVSVVYDIDAAKRNEHDREIMLAELQHRVRNTLAVVRSIARRTAEGTDSVDDMLAHFEGRLTAFSRVQSALAQSPDGAVDLAQLIEDELLAHASREGEGLKVKGPRVLLRQKAAERISLAVHELATNAVKHGALAARDGKIAIRWRVGGRGKDRALHFSWEEQGLNGRTEGPNHPGFGMELLTEILPYDLSATTDVEFDRNGLRFRMELPARHLGGGAPPRGV